MAVFSVNQATQMYVGTTTTSKGTNLADHVYYYNTTDGYRSDLIKKANIISENVKTVAALAESCKIKAPTITVGTVTAGDEYVVRLLIEGDNGMTNAYIKTVGVVATSDASKLAKDIADALNTAASRDITPLYNASASGTKVTITPILKHTVGKMFILPIITVEIANLTTPDETVTINGKNGWVNNNAVIPDQSSTVKYSVEALDYVKAKLKDLEYFCAGERGDQYRGAAWPNEIPFESKLGSLAATWSVRTIHYYEDCSNEAVQKSEKTLVLICASDPGAAKA